MYWLRANAPGSPPPFQARETYDLELYVAGRVQLDIPMRELTDTYNREAYAGGYLPPKDEAIVHTYAADFSTTYAQPLGVLLGSSGTLLSTLSYVIDPRQVRDLPLSGRDIYTMLVALPGVTADNATARGLGLSVNGQRSSSLNFLLDGVENNDYLLTGPLTVIAPEAVQEYRVSTNNFSAEYGRTTDLLRTLSHAQARICFTAWLTATSTTRLSMQIVTSTSRASTPVQDCSRRERFAASANRSSCRTLGRGTNHKGPPVLVGGLRAISQPG